MLAGYFGSWRDGQEVRREPSRVRNEDRIDSDPDLAYLGKYGIELKEKNTFGNGEWHVGGLIGRAATPDASIELFAKKRMKVRGHNLYEADNVYEFYLLVRPRGNPYGRLVRQWAFGAASLLLSGDAMDATMFRRSTRDRRIIEEQIMNPPRGARREHFAEAYLDFDPQTKIATVTIIGLKRPFEEGIDLSEEMQAPAK